MRVSFLGESEEELQKRLEYEQQLNDLYSTRVDINTLYLSNFREGVDSAKEHLKILKDEKSLTSQLNKSYNRALKVVEDSYSLSNNILGNYKEQEQIQEKIGKLSVSRLNLDTQMESLKTKILDEQNDKKKKALEDSVEEIIQLKSVIDDLEIELRNTYRISEKLGKHWGISALATTRKIIEEIPILRKFSKPFEKAHKKLAEIVSFKSRLEKGDKDLLKDFENLSKKEKEYFKDKGIDLSNYKTALKAANKSTTMAFLEGIGGMINISQITKGFGIGFIVKFISDNIKSAFALNDFSVNIGKSIGLSNEEANEFTFHLRNAANYSDKLYINSTNAIKSFNSLSQELGYVSKFSIETLETFTLLTNMVGMSDKEATNLYKISVLNNQEYQKSYENLLGGVVAIKNQTHSGLNLNQVLKDASQMSAVLRSNLQNNPKAIGEAVASLEAMGMKLQDVNSLTGSLLNFQSSIKSELEAELMSNKELHLAKAREAALMGDIKTLTEEVANQMGTIEEYSGMNVLQQQKLAGAFGISRERMAEILEMKKMSLETGKSLSQITEEEAIKANERVSAQKKYNIAIEKVKGILANLLSGPFLQIIESGANLLSEMSQFLIENKWLVSAFAGGAVGSIAGPLGTLIGATGGAIIGAFNQADDNINDGIVQDGKVITTNPEDYLIATKDPQNFVGNIQNNVNLDGLKQEMSEMKEIMKQFVNKNFTINMDGHKVGEVLDSTYNIA